MPNLVVLMPVHNGEAYVRSSVVSTLRALPEDSQLLIADDGSTDRTADILSEFDAEPRVILVRNEQSKGIAVTLNELLVRSDSEFVARMDADDLCLPRRFQRQLALTDRADVVFTRIERIDGDGNRLSAEMPGNVSTNAAPLHLLLANFVTHPTALIRRGSLPDGGYRRLAAEDYDLWLRMASSGARILRDWRPGLQYRVHDAQVSTSEAFDHRRFNEAEFLALLDSYRALAARLGLDDVVGSDQLKFAMSMTPPTRPESREGVLRLHARVLDAARSLPIPDRIILNLRLRSLNKRLQSRPE